MVVRATGGGRRGGARLLLQLRPNRQRRRRLALHLIETKNVGIMNQRFAKRETVANGSKNGKGWVSEILYRSK